MSEQLYSQALSVLDNAKLIPAARTDEDYSALGHFIVHCKRLIAKINDAHKPSIQAAHDSHKAAIALRDSHIQPITAALRIVEPLALAYKQAKDAEAWAETNKLLGTARWIKEATALADAEALEAMGFAEDADAKLAEAVAPTRITPITSTLPKVPGLSTRKRWTARITDARAVKRDYCQPSESAIKAKVDNAFYKVSQVTPEMIQALQDEVGGIVVEEVETMVGRTK